MLSLAALIAVGCGGQKQLLKEAETEVNIPCSGPEYSEFKRVF